MSKGTSSIESASSQPITRDQVANENSQNGADPANVWMDDSCRLRINGVEYSKLYNYAKRNNLPTDGDIYETCINDLKAKGKM